MKYEELSAVGADAVAVAKLETVGLYERSGKRLFDIAFALLLLPLLAPIIAILWLVARADGGTGFFGHTRIGRDRTKFTCWKIRSMVNDADKRLVELLAKDPEALKQWKLEQKLTNDPRITKFGAFVRRTSLDELPQILNVLKGEMSFVGPRPIVEDELERYGSFKDKYLSAKPGVTGLWQVSGRNDCTYDERVRLDAAYKDSITFATDLRVIILTVGCVVSGTGK